MDGSADGGRQRRKRRAKRTEGPEILACRSLDPRGRPRDRLPSTDAMVAIPVPAGMTDRSGATEDGDSDVSAAGEADPDRDNLCFEGLLTSSWICEQICAVRFDSTADAVASSDSMIAGLEDVKFDLINDEFSKDAAGFFSSVCSVCASVHLSLALPMSLDL